MKNFVKFLQTACAILLMTITINAQSGGEEMRAEFKERAGKRHAKAVEKLGLSDEQAVEFKAIQKKYREEVKAAKAEITSKSEMADARYEIHKAKTAEIQRLLTPAQYEIFDTIDANRKKGKKGKGGKKGAKKSQGKSRL